MHSADTLLTVPWQLCADEPGVILADLGAAGRPDVVTVDLNHALTDDDAARIAAYIVRLHNATLARGVPPVAAE